MSDALTPIARAWEAIPFVRMLGATIDAIHPDGVRLRLPHRQLTANRNGTLHGGVSAALANVAGTLAARTGQADPATAGYSLDLAVSYLAPSTRPIVFADARVLRRGRDVTHVDVEVLDDTGVLLAKSLVVHRVAATPADAPLSAPAVPAVGFAPHQTSASASPFTAHLAVALQVPGPGRGAAFLARRDDLLDEHGSLHEGAVASLVDSAGGVAAWAVDGFDPRGRSWTVGMHLHFHGPDRRESLVAHAQTVGRHHGLHFGALTILGHDSGRVLASGTITFQIVRPSAGAPT
jgi:uncharacterized protein (TIGR00369 family)